MQRRELKHTQPRRPLMFQMIMAASLILMALVLFPFLARVRPGGDDLTRLTNRGKFHYDKGETAPAIELFLKVLKLNPNDPDTLLNVANGYLLANDSSNAIHYAQEVLDLDHNIAAAHYIVGCAEMRRRNYEAALKSLQQAKEIEPTVDAVTFQLARAHQELGHFPEAVTELEELVGFVPDHPAAHYTLSQLYVRTDRPQEAQAELEVHRKIQEKRSGAPSDLATFERCRHTDIRVPFRLDQPDATGVAVVFKDATAETLGANAANYHGPIGVIDLNHDGRNSLFLQEGTNGFRLLINSNGTFHPHTKLLPAIAGTTYHRCLVAELHQDRFEDVIVLGDNTSHVFKFATNATITEVTSFAGLKDVSGIDGALVDLDFTGKLDVLTLSTNGTRIQSFRNLGSFFFKENTTTTGVPDTLQNARQLLLDDWNNDDLPDVFIARQGLPPFLLTKTRGGPLTTTNSPADWPKGDVLVVGDVNNDLRTDLLVASKDRVSCVFNGLSEQQTIPLGLDQTPKFLKLVDYDNDGWLDLLVAGSQGLRVFRNVGLDGFTEVTSDLGLDTLLSGRVDELVAADFDRDGDTDLAAHVEGQGLRVLRNEGGNANRQLKVRLRGNRSNPSGLGIRLELMAGGLRTSRTVSQLPIEVGIGQNTQVDSLTVRWFDLAVSSVEIQVEPDKLLTLEEIELPTGSCPYLYAWDGQKFRFVTDILSAAPAGLPVAEGRYVEADPEEYVWLGDETLFPNHDGYYDVRITEELREVLYLDEVKLVAVDHPPNTEVHTTSKMMPGRPFPPHEIWTLHRRRPLLQALNHEGTEVTQTLLENDAQLVSPTRLRVPQLRGLAEPNSVTLDFGPLPVEHPLVLALTGWLRFGGGMANVAASHNPNLPFPFPKLEVQTSTTNWLPVDVTVGVPAGKTKTILVDLEGKLPPGSRQLRLSTAFELHWDRIALFEKVDDNQTHITNVPPTLTDLHWRGFGEFADLPWYYPLTPIYDQVDPNPNWRITPSGWCTRYGEVKELVAQKDNTLVLINGGDELSLRFASQELPPKPAGAQRDYFLYTVGWDKDSDFYVAAGTTVTPIPWHGMDDQQYGKQPRPAFPNDDWMTKYNTRWIGPRILSRK